MSLFEDDTIIAYDDKDDWFSTQFTRSYSCNAQMNYTKFISNNASIGVMLTTSNWQVQAFQFRDQTDGNYDNGTCN